MQPVPRRKRLVGVASVRDDRRVRGEEAHQERRAGPAEARDEQGLELRPERGSERLPPARDRADDAPCSVREHRSNVERELALQGERAESDQNPLVAGAPAWTAATSGRSTQMGIFRIIFSRATASTLSTCECRPSAQPPSSNVVRSSAVPGVGLSR